MYTLPYRPGEKAGTVTEPGYVREKTYVGSVLKYENGRAFVMQRNKISDGDEAEIISPGKKAKKIGITDMRDESGKCIDSAPHPKMVFSFPLTFEALPGDMIRK